MVPPCASERLQAATLYVVAPTAAQQPMFLTSAPKAHPHPPSAPPATAHARRAPPAASAPLQAKTIPNCANLAPTLPLLAQHLPQFALLALGALFQQLLVCLQCSLATAAHPARTVLQVHCILVAVRSTRMLPLLVAPAPAQPASGKRYPPRDRASA